MYTLKKCLIVISAFFFITMTASAEPVEFDEDKVLSVAVVKMPGVVYVNHDEHSLDGLLPKLALPILKDMGFDLEYYVVDLEKAFSDDYDLVLGGINVTYEREQKMNFSTAYLTSGSSFLLPRSNDVAWHQYVYSVLKAMLYPSLIFLAYVIISGHILWWKEKGIDSIVDGYREGVKEGMWVAFQIGTTIGSGDIMPRTWGGRLMAVSTYFVGVFVFAYVITASGSAVDDLEESTTIRGPSDLKGLSVAVKKGSASIPTIESLGAKVTLVDSIMEAGEYIDINKVDLGVFDQPVVADFLKNNTGFKTTDDTFFEKTYHIAIADKYKDIVEELNQKILLAMQTQEYKMYCDWYLKRSCY